MKFQFYGFEVRSSRRDDLALATAWTTAGDPRFWIRQEMGRESFLVLRGSEPIAFYQIEHVIAGQARIHFQSGPCASRKILLHGITMLVPLIEKALSMRGVKGLFFTSHSKTMAEFMHRRMGYDYAGNFGGADGVMMAKGIGAGAVVTSKRVN